MKEPPFCTSVLFSDNLKINVYCKKKNSKNGSARGANNKITSTFQEVGPFLINY